VRYAFGKRMGEFSVAIFCGFGGFFQQTLMRFVRICCKNYNVILCVLFLQHNVSYLFIFYIVKNTTFFCAGVLIFLLQYASIRMCLIKIKISNKSEEMREKEI
jgi:hypothetical protein